MYQLVPSDTGWMDGIAPLPHRHNNTDEVYNTGGETWHVGEGEVVGVSSSLSTSVKLATPESCCSGPVGPTNLLALESLKDKTRDAGTITDVCSGGELPEVEIISLLEEQIPRYRLRADTLTQFTGYENEDWFIPAPALKPEEVDLNLTPDQIREALNYFPRSPDLTPLDFFVWGFMKENVYATEITDRGHLLQRMNAAATDIRLRNGLLELVDSAVIERGQARLCANGGHFERLLQ
ncbi:hypothetical protein ANN_17207 [Periplaneta americana]|uniref:HAP1 N-terminal domain-containing protein n=1 Tax=Periplaneta americana TaxID=6978 RepID=A0ABQ8STP7_PERAM|nr:hypothetical protein ANN_17207 [Periplaneta americana]